MLSIKTSNKVVGISAEMMIHYLMYRKAKRLERSMSTPQALELAEETTQMYLKNIKIEMEKHPKLSTTNLEELLNELERVAVDLI